MTDAYGPDLATVHHAGYGSHADSCAPGILAMLAPVRARRGVVLELGAGTGHLTRHLLGAGHHVIAVDASAAMLDVLGRALPRDDVRDAGTLDVRRLVLPDDPLPACDAVVGVGHVLNYLPDEAAVTQALAAIAAALRPDGVLALDLEDLRWGQARIAAPAHARLGDDWAIITEFDVPRPERFVRHITTFVRGPYGSWQRGTETHANVLLDTARLPALLAGLEIEAAIGRAFGDETLPDGLVTVVGRRLS